MSFRTVVISSNCKLSYKNDYLVVRNEEGMKSVHLSEIENVLIDSTAVSLSSHLLLELIKNKIKVVFCDEKRNPYGEFVPYYGSYNHVKKIQMQCAWKEDVKKKLWKKIVQNKIKNQAYLLFQVGSSKSDLLMEYAHHVQLDDQTNREGHAAKVYFNSLFGVVFSRNQKNDINAALNYGYAIILSLINKEIINNGYLTQMGIKHKNEFNFFNLSCDFIEVFRPIIDRFVYYHREEVFSTSYKMNLVNLLNHKYYYCGKLYFLSDIIRLYVKNMLDSIEQGKVLEGKEFLLDEGKNYANNPVF